ncbi:MAG TPA: hydrogenase maturation protease [Chloroflexi bacterium]|nr:hydrogenase maturation protease [Chloroflexota bacterium]
MSDRVVVCGLGQTLRGDDAVGLEAVRRWQASDRRTATHPAVAVHLLELPGLALLDVLEGARAALLVDAVVSGAPAGMLHHLPAARLEAFVAGATSAHGWGVAETLRLAHTLGRPLPPVVEVLAIEAADLRLGASLSPAVAAALPAAVNAIAEWVRRQLPAEVARA